MKRRSTIAALLLLFIGIGIMGYPVMSNLIHSINTNKEAKEYIDQMNTKFNEDELERIYQEMRAYNKALYKVGQKDLSDPFAYEQASFDLTQFGFEENIIGYLTIDKINLIEPIYLGARKDNLNRGTAHLTETSLPIGGNNTNAVIAGHRGMISKAMFRNIHKLEIDDRIEITNFREKLYYRVKEMKIIDPSDIEDILIQQGKDMVTLISCNPLGHNYERYVVYCERETVIE